MPSILPSFYTTIKETSNTDIKFQGFTNACYIYGSVTTLEYQLRTEQNRETKLSIQQLQKHVTYPTIPAVLNHMSSMGVPSSDGRNIKISGYITLTNTDAMKNWIVKKGPLIAYIRLYIDFFFYKKGVYRNSVPIPLFNEHHCISIIGYDDTKGAWLCQNSWSRSWGENGYCWIEYGTCGIDEVVYAITGIE